MFQGLRGFAKLKGRVLRWAGCGMVLAAASVAQGQAPPRNLAKPAPPPAPPAKVVVQPHHPNDCVPAACCHADGHFVLESILGPANCTPWTPLCLSNLSEGWTDPWIRPPDGSSGALRQGLLNTFDGFFTREIHLFHFWEQNIANRGDRHIGLFQYQTPLSRRLWISIDTPIEGLSRFGPANTTRFGDLAISTKAMLQETQDTSLNAGMTVRTPTGSTATGSDLLTLTPFTQFWVDMGSPVSLRGGLALEVPINDTARTVLPDATLIGSLAIAQTITPASAAPVGDFTYYLALNARQDIGSSDEHTFLAISPGIRTRLIGNLFFLAAYEVDVVGPRPFDQRVFSGFVWAW